MLIDLLIADQKEPSLDDWGSAGACAGRASIGIMAHQVLPRVYVRALPSWSRMHPSQTILHQDSERCDAERIRVQKKSWRARLALTESDRMLAVLLLTCCAYPVD